MLCCCLVRDLHAERSGRWWGSMTERYVELHAASAFSFLEGASQPEELIERAVELEMPAMALLDRNGVYGSARFHTSAKRNSSARSYWSGDCRIELRIAADASGHGCRISIRRTGAPAAALRIARGYQNLCQLITHFKMRETTKSEGAATFDDLQQYASGLVCLTGGDEGPLAAALTRGGERQAVKRSSSWYESSAARMSMSNCSVIRSVKKNGAIRLRFASRVSEAAGARDQWSPLCNRIRPRGSGSLHGDPPSHELDQAGRLLALNSQRHLRRAREMAALFRDVPGAIENTVDLSSRLGLS